MVCSSQNDSHAIDSFRGLQGVVFFSNPDLLVNPKLAHSIGLTLESTLRDHKRVARGLDTALPNAYDPELVVPAQSRMECVL